ncbi:unnamed protein product [Withania somnifera]
MAAVKSSVVSLFLLGLLLVVLQSRVIESQPLTCPSALTNLNVCAPFVLPGSPSASAECCNALQSINHDCMCETMRIAAQIPSQCNLPPLSCAAN